MKLIIKNYKVNITIPSDSPIHLPKLVRWWSCTKQTVLPNNKTKRPQMAAELYSNAKLPISKIGAPTHRTLFTALKNNEKLIQSKAV